MLLRESRPSSLTLQTSNPPLSPRLVANPQEPIYSLHPFKILRAFLYPRPVRNRRRGREIRILGCEVTLSQAFVPRDGRRFQRHVLLDTVVFTYWRLGGALRSLRGRKHVAPMYLLRLSLSLHGFGEVVLSALAGKGRRGVWRKGEEEGHFYVLFRCGVPAFIFDHDSTPYAHFVAEPRDEVGVAAWEAYGQDWTCWCVGEGDG